MAIVRKISGCFLIPALAILVVAGTLDHAPFHIAPPNRAWKVNDSLVQPRSRGVYIMASLTNVQSRLSARIIKTEFTESQEKSVEEMCGNMRVFLNSVLPPVNTTADSAITFLGHKARRFCWQTYSKSRAMRVYTETVMFEVGRTAWTVDCTGNMWQTNEVREFFNMVRP